MKYVWTTIMVKNLQESLAFYQEIIGLPIKKRFFANQTREIAFLGEGETQVELIEQKDATFVIGNAITLGFKVESLQKALEFVAQKGIPVESGPFQPNEHTQFFFILDPNGVRIQFAQLS
ncbi:MAG: VOC family protein [Sphaerochaetaceae bacterium]